MTDVNKKKIYVYFIELSQKEYVLLKNNVENDLKNNKLGSYNKKLLDSIDRVVYCLNNDSHYGINIPKDRFPRVYILNYDVTNLWKCNIFDFWRLIYTIKGNDTEIFVAIIEFMDHNTYNRRFGYRD